MGAFETRRQEERMGTGMVLFRGCRWFSGKREGKLIIGLLLLSLLLFLAYFAHRTSRISTLKTLIQTDLEAGDFQKALSHLEDLNRISPKNDQINPFLRPATRGLIDSFIKTKNYSQARQTLRELAHLFGTEALYAEFLPLIAFAEAQDLFDKGKTKQAQETIDATLAKLPHNLDLTYQAGCFYHRTGINWERSLRLLHDAGRDGSQKYLHDPVYIDEMTWFLKNLMPSDGFDEIRDFLADNLFQHFKPLLTENLFNLDAPKALRWNALKIFQFKKEPFDEVKFYLQELLNPDPNPETITNQETIDYFARRLMEGPAEDLKQKLFSPISSFPLLDRAIFPPESPLIRIIDGIFFEALEPFLHAALTNFENTNRRVNAFQILAMKGMTAVDALKFHGANIISWVKGTCTDRFYPVVQESLNYWKNDSGKILTEMSLPASETVELQGPLADPGFLRKEVKKAIEDIISQMIRDHQAATEAQDNEQMRIIEERLNLFRETLASIHKRPGPSGGP